VLDDLSSGLLSNLPTHERLRFVEGSVLDRDLVSELALDTSLVLHAAGVVGMRLATVDVGRTYAVAVDGTSAVLECTEDCPVILFSSSAVYGTAPGLLTREEDTVSRSAALAYDGGIQGYATGKWEMEHLGRRAGEAGRSVLVIRPFNVVGPGQLSRFGMVVPTFVQRALQGQAIEVHDDGLQSRTFSEVGTFVDCFWRLLVRSDLFEPTCRVLNIGSAESTRILDLARIVLEETGSASPLQQIPYAQIFPGRQDVSCRGPDPSRLHALLGSVAWPDARAIVRDVIRGYLDSADDESASVSGV